MKEQFGDRLFRLRKENNLTMEELANAIKNKYTIAKLVLLLIFLQNKKG